MVHYLKEKCQAIEGIVQVLAGNASRRDGRAGGGVRSRRGSAILMYHSLDVSGSPISMRPTLFHAQMERLAVSGVPVRSLAEAVVRPGSVALTFDDGHRSFLDVALPVLHEFSFPVTVFVTAGFCGRSSEWLSWNELIAIANSGFELGAHSVDHRDLTTLSSEQVLRELRDSERSIEDHTGVAVEAFAYPFGRSNDRVRRLTARVFRRACGTNFGLAKPTTDQFNLPRIDACRLRESFGGTFLSCVVDQVRRRAGHRRWWPIA